MFPLFCSLFFNLTATTGFYTFPYTTLFRSASDAEASEYQPNLNPFVQEKFLHRPANSVVRNDFRPSRRFVATTKLHGFTDRKSTRLNSSHLGISYAVFCLKKKKKKNRLYSI